MDRKKFWSTPLPWTAKQSQAAVLTALERLTRAEICKKLGMHLRTLEVLKAHPEFQERVEAHRIAAEQEILTTGIARKARRIERLNRDWERMQALVDARAEAARADVPGADTGLLGEEETPVRGGGSVVNYSFDAALMKELREAEKQAAIETGQWTEKRDVTSGGKSFVDIARALDLDE